MPSETRLQFFSAETLIMAPNLLPLRLFDESLEIFVIGLLGIDPQVVCGTTFF
jgi:hypothetical protein